MNPIWAGIISELLINLAAAWLAAIFIVPTFSPKPFRLTFIFWLTTSLLVAILSLVTAFQLRMITKL